MVFTKITVNIEISRQESCHIQKWEVFGTQTHKKGPWVSINSGFWVSMIYRLVFFTPIKHIPRTELSVTCSNLSLFLESVKFTVIYTWGLSYVYSLSQFWIENFIMKMFSPHFLSTQLYYLKHPKCVGSHKKCWYPRNWTGHFSRAFLIFHKDQYRWEFKSLSYILTSHSIWRQCFHGSYYGEKYQLQGPWYCLNDRPLISGVIHYYLYEKQIQLYLLPKLTEMDQNDWLNLN